MAYTTINKSTDHFHTKLYTATGSAQSITGVGFQPDLVWIKDRESSGWHFWTDAVRGVTKTLFSNTNNAVSTETGGLTAFGTDGFSIGTHSNINTNGNNIVSWNWKAGTTGSGNTGGSGTYKTYSYSVNTTAGFSIVTYTGNGTGGHTIPHHLGVAPSNVIIKDYGATNSWICKMKGYDGYLYLEKTDTGTSNSTWLPTDANNLTLANTWGAYNTNNSTYVAYCFAEKTGYSKFGSYTGNGSSSSPSFIYTGFKPKFVIVKCTNEADAWFMHDNKRDGYNDDNEYLFPNLTNVEGTNVNRLSMYYKQLI